MTTIMQHHRDALVRLAHRAEVYPDLAYERELAERSAIDDRIERGIAFDNLRTALDQGGGETAQALDVLLGTDRYRPGDIVIAEPGRHCRSCGGHELVFMCPVPDAHTVMGYFRCDNVNDHVSGRLSWAIDYVAVRARDLEAEVHRAHPGSSAAVCSGRTGLRVTASADVATCRVCAAVLAVRALLMGGVA